MTRIAFLGNDARSVPPLRSLADAGVDVALVLTQSPRPAGRGNRLAPSPVATAASDGGLPLLELETVRTPEALATLRALSLDALIVVAYGEILDDALLAVATPVNLHFSLLPRWRGAAPVQRAIMEGDLRTGVSTVLMEAELDAGPILLQRTEEILLRDDAGSLGERLATIGGTVVVETVDRLGSIQPLVQDDALVTYAPKIGAEERRIDWRRPADQIDRVVRGLMPRPTATMGFRDTVIKVLRGLAGPEADPPSEPGTVTVLGDEVWVSTGDGRYRLLEVVPQGRHPMPADAWARGVRMVVGERVS